MCLQNGKRNEWPVVRGVCMNPVEHPFGGGNHQHIGKPATVRRDKAHGRKVLLSPALSPTVVSAARVALCLQVWAMSSGLPLSVYAGRQSQHFHERELALSKALSGLVGMGSNGLGALHIPGGGWDTLNPKPQRAGMRMLPCRAALLV